MDFLDVKFTKILNNKQQLIPDISTIAIDKSIFLIDWQILYSTFLFIFVDYLK
jgi:hypothetical protein